MTTNSPNSTLEPKYDPVIRLPKVCELTGLGKSSIYAGMKDNTFPKSIPIGAKARGWRLSTINKWIDDRENNYG